MKTPKVVVDADLFLGHLVGERSPSLLRMAMQRFFCYTTVFQAIELFSLGRTDRDRRAIEDSMAAVKVLGLNAKNAPAFGRLLATAGSGNVLASLTIGLCLESRLPLLTGRQKRYRRSGVPLIPTSMLEEFETGDEILKAVARAARRAG